MCKDIQDIHRKYSIFTPSLLNLIMQYEDQQSYTGLIYRSFPHGSVVKNPLAMKEMETKAGSVPGQRRSPEEVIVMHSSILALKKKKKKEKKIHRQRSLVGCSP